MMDKTIALVWESTGEYSDRAERPVIAFTTMADAEAFVLRASELEREAGTAARAWERTRWGDGGVFIGDRNHKRGDLPEVAAWVALTGGEPYSAGDATYAVLAVALRDSLAEQPPE